MLAASRASSNHINRLAGGKASAADLHYVAQQHMAIRQEPILPKARLAVLSEALVAFADECAQKWSSQAGQHRCAAAHHHTRADAPWSALCLPPACIGSHGLAAMSMKQMEASTPRPCWRDRLRAHSALAGPPSHGRISCCGYGHSRGSGSVGCGTRQRWSSSRLFRTTTPAA